MRSPCSLLLAAVLLVSACSGDPVAVVAGTETDPGSPTPIEAVPTAAPSSRPAEAGPTAAPSTGPTEAALPPVTGPEGDSLEGLILAAHEMPGWIHGGTGLNGPARRGPATGCEPLEAFDDALGGERLESAFFHRELELLSSGYRLASPAAVADVITSLDTVSNACPVVTAASGARYEATGFEVPAGGDRAAGVTLAGDDRAVLLVAYQVGTGVAVLELESDEAGGRAQLIIEAVAEILAAKLDGRPLPDPRRPTAGPTATPLPALPESEWPDHPLVDVLIRAEDLGGNWQLMFADVGDPFDDSDTPEECPAFAGFPPLDGVMGAYGESIGADAIFFHFVGRGAPGEASEYVAIFERLVDECPRFTDADLEYGTAPLPVPPVKNVDAYVGVRMDEGPTRIEYLIAAQDDVVIMVGQFAGDPDADLFDADVLSSLVALTADRLVS